MQKPGQKSAMISSTAIDLPEHRKQVLDACLCEDVFPIGMESLPSRDADAIRVSMEMVDKADIYIGIFAFRYGHIPKGHNISITEMEYKRAVERRIPILVFIMHHEHPITIATVETNNVAQQKIKKLKKSACKGRGRSEFKSASELKAQVVHALSALKRNELENSSPIDRIRAEKQRLEALDSKAIVDVTADSKSLRYNVTFPHAELKFPDNVESETLKAFLEKGQSFQIKAKDFRRDISPILNELLKEAGDSSITIASGLTFNGCIQFTFRSQKSGSIQLQIDGEWTLAPKRAKFVGRLTDSPLAIEYVRETSENSAPDICFVRFGLEFQGWTGQPIQGLAFFSEIYALMHQASSTVRSIIKGNQIWPEDALTLTGVDKKRINEALAWLERSRAAAKYLNVNPLFPEPDTINANASESKNVHLMFKLIETGFHEQGYENQIVAFTGENNGECPAIGAKGLAVSLPEHSRKINFYGMEIPFGPINNVFTNLELVKTQQLPDNRVELQFRGGPNSTWRIEYVRQK